MDEKKIRKILEEVSTGKTTVAEGASQIGSLKDPGFTDLGFAKIDHHRELRKGFPETILCEGKETHQIISILETLLEKNASNIILTRADESVYQEVSKECPEAEYRPEARTVIIRRQEPEEVGKVVVATGGTADIPVAEEACAVAEAMGSSVTRLFDIGVAGAHRLFAHLEELQAANAIVVVAGMEGALASIVGGLVRCPVIAVPTSVGYGASFGGLAALLAMLNTCAEGVAVVNIDNGFGAGYLTSIINLAVARASSKKDER